MDIFGMILEPVKQIVVDNAVGFIAGTVTALTINTVFGIWWDMARPLKEPTQFMIDKMNLMGLKTREYLNKKLGDQNAKKVIEELDAGSEKIQAAFSSGLKGYPTKNNA